MDETQQIAESGNNSDFFKLVYDQHYQTIFNYCFRRTANFDDSKDITSETFIKAYLHFGRFKWKGIPILNWLYRIASNEVNQYYRSKKYKPKLLSDTYGVASIFMYSFTLDEEKKEAEIELEKHREFTKLLQAIKKLPMNYQEVISLKYFEQLKIKEISVILNKKEGTVKSLLSRGIAQLRKNVIPINKEEKS